MEESAAHRRAAASERVATLMLRPRLLCFLAGCYYVTHSLRLHATVSCRGRETEMMAGILRKTQSRATVVSWSEDNCKNTCSTLIVTRGPLSASWSLCVTHTHPNTLTALCLCVYTQQVLFTNIFFYLFNIFFPSVEFWWYTECGPIKEIPDIVFTVAQGQMSILHPLTLTLSSPCSSTDSDQMCDVGGRLCVCVCVIRASLGERQSHVYFKSTTAPAHMLHASTLSLFLLLSATEQFTLTFRW